LRRLILSSPPEPTFLVSAPNKGPNFVLMDRPHGLLHFSKWHHFKNRREEGFGTFRKNAVMQISGFIEQAKK